MAPGASAAPPVVALVGNPQDDAALARLRAELEALGFQVVAAPLPGSPPGRDALEKTARETGAVATVRLAPGATSGAVEVWILDRVTGKTVLREVVAPDASGRGGESDPATVALRAVELLRASLLEVDAPHPPRGDVAPTEEIRALVRPDRPPPPAPPPPAPPPPAPPRAAMFESVSIRPGPIAAPARFPRFGAYAGVAFGGSPGGVPPGPLVDLRVRWMPFGRFGLAAGALIPTLAGTITTPEAAAEASFGFVTGGGRAELGSPASTWSPSVECGLAASWLHVQGIAASPRLAVLGETAFGAAPYARAGLSWAVRPWLALRAEVLGAIVLPRARVDFAGTTVARWGQPFIAGSAGVEISMR